MSRDRIEIVESSAEQPWSVRFFRNKQTFRSSENYSRKIGAQRAVLSLAKMFGWDSPLLAIDADGKTCLTDGLTPTRRIPVLYLREMDEVPEGRRPTVQDLVGRP